VEGVDRGSISMFAGLNQVSSIPPSPPPSLEHACGKREKDR
jgi:hypothetical protein